MIKILSHALASAIWVASAAGQPTPDADPQAAAELPAQVRESLRTIEDFSFSFSQEGFYALLECLKTTDKSPGHSRLPIEVDDWRVLLERPAEFRGQPITVQGVVGRNKAWRFEQEERQNLGTVWQLELWRPDQPIAVTLILTEDVGDIPVGATVRASAYFLMIRQYYSDAKRLRQAALLIGHGPTVVSQPASQADTPSRAGMVTGLLVALTAALLITWLLLRRSLPRGGGHAGAPRSSGPAPQSLAEDLSAWAARLPPHDQAHENLPSNDIESSDHKNDSERS